VRCWYENRGALLADEMGLGKTIQAVAFMDHLRKKETAMNPFIVIAPLSTIVHWQRELAAWTDLTVIKYMGDSESREFARKHDWILKETKQGTKYKWDVLITTYETLRTDYSDLTKVRNIYFVFVFVFIFIFILLC
jgi:SNF2 family DNA or RNA helicase